MRRKEEMKYGKSEVELKQDEMRLALVKHRRETEEAELERRRKGEFAAIHFKKYHTYFSIFLQTVSTLLRCI